MATRALRHNHNPTARKKGYIKKGEPLWIDTSLSFYCRFHRSFTAWDLVTCLLLVVKESGKGNSLSGVARCLLKVGASGVKEEEHR